MNWDKLAWIAVGLECESGIGQRLRKIDLPKDIPAFAGITRSIPRNAFLKRCHVAILPLNRRYFLQLDDRALRLSSTAVRFTACLAWICCKNLKYKIYAKT